MSHNLLHHFPSILDSIPFFTLPKSGRRNHGKQNHSQPNSLHMVLQQMFEKLCCHVAEPAKHSAMRAVTMQHTSAVAENRQNKLYAESVLTSISLGDIKKFKFGASMAPVHSPHHETGSS